MTLLIQVNAIYHLQSLHSSVLLALNELVCPSCNLTDNNIRNEELSCRGVTNNQQIIYRARIIGTEKNSAGHLVSLLNYWVQTSHASLLVGFLRLHVDPRCATPLDSLLAPDCIIMETLTTMGMTTEKVTTAVTTANHPTPQPLTSGETGGLILGCIVAILLTIFIVLLIVVIVRCFKNGFR